jgi:aminoglycoside phosphotransferase (APT) family kinase protein
MNRSMVCDPAIPFLTDALDARRVQQTLQEHLAGVRVRSTRLLRHKPGRRCLIEYQVETSHGAKSLLGKIRAKGLDGHALSVQRSCWMQGLPVARPVGALPEFRMWLQERVPGSPSLQKLHSPSGVTTARQVADLIFFLHEAEITSDRKHTEQDELAILQQRLASVAGNYPELEERLSRILRACQQLTPLITRRPVTGIHRDFYQDHVILNGSRGYLIDLDLLCEGDPALDIGNFVAHLTEHSLRSWGDPGLLKQQESAVVERYLERTSEANRRPIEAYTVLSLVRHIQLSTEIPGRSHTTLPLLDLSERMLDEVLGRAVR